MRIEGEAVYIDLNGKRHSIEGIGNLSDITALKSLKVSGAMTFDGITCDKLDIEGDGRGKSAIAKDFSVSGSVEIDSVNVENLFKISGSTEIENLIADKIIMESRGGSIGKIKCNELRIFHANESGGGFLSNIFGSRGVKTGSRVRIGQISGGKVELQNCEVEEVNCTDAFIGSNCIIKKLIVEGECEIDDDSQVGETIRKNS